MTNFDSPVATFAVVSDLHAFSKAENSADSVIDFSGKGASVPNPLTDLLEEVKKRRIEVDALLCPGDICNKADAGGLSGAWTELHKIKDALSAERLISTCGNHDLDSRFLDGEIDPDPKGALLNLKPGFPFDEQVFANQFWAQNYVVMTLANGVVVVTLNTSAYHGGKQEEINHGRVSQRTISAIANEVALLKDAPAHVLVCHHHPLPLVGWKGGPDQEYMRNGQILFDALVSATKKSWLVVHGHRHLPRLIHGASNSTATPFVLGAGSLGARITGIPNQFHLISVYSSSEPDHSSLVGKVLTWSWTDTGGWTEAKQPTGLPSSCGFGYRGQIKPLAARIRDLVGSNFAAWTTIRSVVSSVDFLMPDDFRQLELELQLLGLQILWSGDGQPMQVGS